jgi:hypothetical protein
VSWASTRGLWKKPSVEEEEHDAELWREATREEGGFVTVLWCEVRQLCGDVLPTSVVEALRRRTGR